MREPLRPSYAAAAEVTSAEPEAAAGRAAPAVAQHEAPPRSGRFQTFSSLQYRDYRFLWVGTLFMSAGQWIQQVTLGWLIYDMTGSSVLLGVLQAVRAMPFLLVSPVAGAIVDRFDHRKQMMLTQGILAFTAIVMGVIVWTGLVEIWVIFVFALVTATTWAFNQPLRQILVSKVVPREAVSNAVALSSVAFNTTKVLGPALGGVLIGLFGAGGNFFVQGAAYLGVFISIAFMSVPPNVRSGPKRSVWTNMMEGLVYVRRTPAIFALLVAALVPSVIAMPYQSLIPVFAKDVLHMGPGALGLMLAAPGVGAIAFTLLLASVTHLIRRRGIVLLCSMGMMGVFIMLFSRTDSLPMACAMLVGVGGCQILYNTTNMTLLQLLVPEEYLGRVTSIYMINFGFSPVGALFAGIGSQLIGAPATIAIMGGMVVLMAIAMSFLNPEMRDAEG